MMCPLFLTTSQWNSVSDRIKDLEEKLSKTIADQYVRARLQKEHTALSSAFSLMSLIQSIEQKALKLEEELKEIIDPEMVFLIQEELVSFKDEIARTKQELEEVMYPDSPENDRSVFLEIRAGTGGLEASLFASELTRMYTMYGQKNGWNVSIASLSETEIGGIREIIIHIEGKKVYEKLRHEAGVHRVQRVPTTETSGRVHTSTVTIAVLPEAEEVEVSINPEDLRVDTYRASGAGGQHVNKTDSAIRITHIPSGIVVACQDERSQHKNRARAMKMLQSRILLIEKEKQSKQVSQMRREMVSSGDRSEKVRTYNFPQNRVTDHKIEVTFNRLDYILMGNIEELVTQLVHKARAERSTNQFFVDFIKIKGEVC